MGPEIRATGLASQLLRYNNDAKQWVQHFDDTQPITVQVVHDRTAQSFMLVISRPHEQGHMIIMQQQIYHNMKYQTNNNNHFHQWRGEQRTVFGLSFTNEQHAMDVHRAVREAQNFLAELISSEHTNGSNVYQEPQSHYYSHQPTTAKQHHQQQQSEPVYQDGDGDSLGSNGYNRKYSYAMHSQVTGQAIPQQQPATLQQQQRRASQGSSGSSSTVSSNIYATAHLNGYSNSGNAVSTTSNNNTQMPITQIHHQQQQFPARLNNVHLNGHSVAQSQTNGYHQQVPLRTPVPPAPAPTSVHQPAQVSTMVPPAPPPPPPPSAVNNPIPARTATNVPPAPPPPPPNFCKAASGDKPLTMAEQLKQKQLRKTEQNGVAEANGVSNGAANNNRPKPPGPTMDLMSELNNKLRKRNNQDEIGSVTSAASTSSTLSTNSNESVEKREPASAPKTWSKPVNSISSTHTLNGTHNGYVNGNIDSPKVHKKQFSVSNASVAANEDSNAIHATKADLDKLREDVFAEIANLRQHILEAIANNR